MPGYPSGCFYIFFCFFYAIFERKERVMKRTAILAICLLSFAIVMAQDKEQEEGHKGFRKDNLFTGGGISLGFSNYSFLVGASPVLGYRLADWVDAGIVINYQYNSLRDYPYIDYKQRQSLYGGGAFARLFPLPFLFAQGQFEHNFIHQKIIGPPGVGNSTYNTSANSFLIGVGYMQGRMRGFNSPGYYISILWDVSRDANSPYTDTRGRTIPILRAGINVPLFQGRR